jgi:hypothetical protein
MVKASDFESEDCSFKYCTGRVLLEGCYSTPGGLEAYIYLLKHLDNIWRNLAPRASAWQNVI